MIAALLFVVTVVVVWQPGQTTSSSLASPTPSSVASGSASAVPAPSATAVVTAAPASPTPEPQPTSAPTAAPTTRPAPPPGQGFGNGTFGVGVDVRPGTYRTRIASAGCAWARLNAQGQLITGRTTNDPDIVTILATDGFFRSSGCAAWSLDLTRITNTSLGPVPDGTFLVGTDIVPGVWRATTTAGCSWWRLSEFTGDGSTILGQGTSNPSVTIGGSDRGFRSVNCGFWQKVG